MATLVLQVATMRSGAKAGKLNAKRLQAPELPGRVGAILVARLQNGRSLSASDVLDITAASADALGIRLSPETVEPTLRRVLRSAMLTTEEAITLDHNQKEGVTARLRRLVEDIPDLVSSYDLVSDTAFSSPLKNATLSSPQLSLGTAVVSFWVLAVLQLAGIVDLPGPSVVWIGGGGVILLVVARVWFHTMHRESSRRDISVLAEAERVEDLLTVKPRSLKVKWH